jgi:hypothetical protein
MTEDSKTFYDRFAARLLSFYFPDPENLEESLSLYSRFTASLRSFYFPDTEKS